MKYNQSFNDKKLYFQANHILNLINSQGQNLNRLFEEIKNQDDNNNAKLFNKTYQKGYQNMINIV